MGGCVGSYLHKPLAVGYSTRGPRDHKNMRILHSVSKAEGPRQGDSRNHTLFVGSLRPYVVFWPAVWPNKDQILGGVCV